LIFLKHQKFYVPWRCIKSVSPPAAAKQSSDRDLFSLISLREIRENRSLSKDNLARNAKKNFLYNPIPMENIPCVLCGF